MSDKKKLLSSDLEAIISKKEASRKEVIRLLYAYLEKNNLQCKDDSKYFVPDEKLYKIFGTEKIKKSYMSLYIDAHLSDDDAKNDAKEAKNDAIDAKNDDDDEIKPDMMHYVLRAWKTFNVTSSVKTRMIYIVTV